VEDPLSLQRGDGEPVALVDAVYFPMKPPHGDVISCCVSYNALAMKVKCQTWLSAEQACEIFFAHRDEIEAAARRQFQTGTRLITIGAAELSP
jgi:hypothetical protein